ncbi:MAG: hypothetical protein J6Y02_18050 [Pseudobutyrivibrio sp.]|nr:hypothetical protein [Pseudobutyrivibrio sp.]
MSTTKIIINNIKAFFLMYIKVITNKTFARSFLNCQKAMLKVGLMSYVSLFLKKDLFVKKVSREMGEYMKNTLEMNSVIVPLVMKGGK